MAAHVKRAMEGDNRHGLRGAQMRAKLRLPDPVDVLGVPFIDASAERVAEAVENAAKNGTPLSVAFVGLHGLAEAQQNLEYRRALTDFDLVCADGIIVNLLSRFQRNPVRQRAPGPDVMSRLLLSARDTRLRHFLFGASEEVLSDLHRVVEVSGSGAKIVGSISPPIAADRGPALGASELGMIGDRRPEVFWVALGAPKQEFWISDNSDLLPPCVVLGVGAAFNFLAGHVKRAPSWVREWGLEWIWRMMMEPHRMVRRNLGALNVLARALLKIRST